MITAASAKRGELERANHKALMDARAELFPDYREATFAAIPATCGKYACSKAIRIAHVEAHDAALSGRSISQAAIATTIRIAEQCGNCIEWVSETPIEAPVPVAEQQTPML